MAEIIDFNSRKKILEKEEMGAWANMSEDKVIPEVFANRVLIKDMSDPTYPIYFIPTIGKCEELLKTKNLSDYWYVPLAFADSIIQKTKLIPLNEPPSSPDLA